MNIKKENYTCLCCGYKTLKVVDMNWFCDICKWEDDPFHAWKPRCVGGPNTPVSLHQAQKNFILYGASAPWCSKSTREPTEEDEFDKDWEPFLKSYLF